MMKLRKVFVPVLLILISLTASVSGTLAYLTDRDSDANVFTIGNVTIELNEDFEQGSELIPGVDIKKIPTITNTGKNDAWVWLELAIPAALDNWNPHGEEGASENVVHWNPLGATTYSEDYHYITEERVTKAIANGYLPEGTNVESIKANNTVWHVFNDYVEYEGKKGNSYATTIDVKGEPVAYNVYVIPYMKALTADETTLPTLTKVYLDELVDIDTNGDWYKVKGGVPTELDWNSDEDGNPVIFVSAYGIQKDGFTTVKEAIDAYVEQWNDKKEWAEVPDLLDVIEDEQPTEDGQTESEQSATQTDTAPEDSDQ